jgi:hypothetical protein
MQVCKDTVYVQGFNEIEWFQIDHDKVQQRRYQAVAEDNANKRAL